MKWKHKIVKELSGGSLSGNLAVVAKAVNYNAELLQEAVQKIEELSWEIERLKEREPIDQGRNSKNHSHNG